MSGDVVIQAVESGAIDGGSISFDRIREVAMAAGNPGVWEELDYGKAVPETCKHLDQYLYSYGPMVQSQWGTVLQSVTLPTENLEIVDYACGQGLGSILLLDRFKNTHLGRVSRIHLIDPSSVALERAQCILQCYCPSARVQSTKKYLDALARADFSTSGKAARVHLLSNILDCESFDVRKLVRGILGNAAKGVHCFLAVSHDRDFAGGSPRVRQFHSLLVSAGTGSAANSCSVLKDSGLRRFQFPGSSGDMGAISFHVEIEV